MERGAEAKPGKGGVGFNTMLPGEVRRTGGTRVSDRERKGVLEGAQECRVGGNTGHRTRAGRDWEGGPVSVSHDQCSDCQKTCCGPTASLLQVDFKFSRFALNE